MRHGRTEVPSELHVQIQGPGSEEESVSSCFTTDLRELLKVKELAWADVSKVRERDERVAIPIGIPHSPMIVYKGKYE